MKRFLIHFGCWLFIFHWWLLLRAIPGAIGGTLGRVGFTQALYWINLPGLPLARFMGSQHFKVEEFGALPQTAVAYAAIALFWIGMAAVLGLTTSALMRVVADRNAIRSRDNHAA